MTLSISERLTARALPPRNGKPSAVIIHTTGDTNLEKILRFYQDKDGLQPHYVIGYDGQIYQTAPEEVVAYHCAIKPDERQAYEYGFVYWSKRYWSTENNTTLSWNGPYPGYARWMQRWRPKFESPLYFVTGVSPNFHSIGIELQQTTSDNRTPDIFTDEQYASVTELVDNICSRYGITKDAEHVLGHSDISPLRRCTIKGGYDPGDAFSWERLLAHST